MHGKIIIIEGLDGCGKSTQVELLKNHFTAPIIFFIVSYLNLLISFVISSMSSSFSS